MITKMPKPRMRPYWASKDIWGRTTGLVLVSLFGHHYELPVTDRTAVILSLLDGAVDPWAAIKKSRRSDWRRREAAERGMMDIIQSLYSQIEAVAVAHAAQSMAQDIQQKLEPLIQKKLHETVEERHQTLTFDGVHHEKKEDRHG